MKRMLPICFIAGIMASVFTVNVFSQSAIPYQWKSVAIRGGGFVTGIIFSPIAQNVMYARTDMAGAYRWDEPSYGWVPITDWMNRSEYKYFGIESIAPDPQNPDRVYLAGGTYLSSGNGAIMRSDDRGKTFRIFSIAAPMGGNADGRSMGERLAVDPNNTAILYFGSRRNGLLKSTNSGETWSVVSSFTARGNTDMGLSLVIFDKSSGTQGTATPVIFVGVASNAAGSGSNLYKSSDAGATWSLVAGGPAALMPHHASLASNGWLWLAYNNNTGPGNVTSGTVWKYTISGNAWTQINPAGHGGGIGSVSVAADDPNFAICGTLDWWGPDEAYRTIDGGTTWTPVLRQAQKSVQGATYLCFGRVPCTGSAISYSGWMGDIRLDPFNHKRAFYTTGQGVWSSSNIDVAVAQILWKFESNNFEETVVLQMPASFKKAVFSIVGDIGGCRNATDSLEIPSPIPNYSNPPYKNGTGFDYAGLNADIVTVVGEVTFSGTGGGGSISRDNGRTWTAFPNQFTRGGRIAISADGATLIWNNQYSRNNGSTWTVCAGVSGTVISDRVDPQKFYAVSGNRILASTDGGATFTGRATATGTKLKTVFGKDGEVWVGGSGGLYRSRDAGATAARVNGPSGINDFGFGQAAPGKAFPSVYVVGTVGSVYGIFRSDDEGATWVRINDDDHEFGSPDYCAGDEDYYGRVYIGPHGRGIQFGEPANTGVVRAIAADRSSPGLLKRSGNRIVARNKGTGPLLLLDVSGRMVRQSQPQSNGLAIDLARLTKGVYLARCGNASLLVLQIE